MAPPTVVTSRSEKPFTYNGKNITMDRLRYFAASLTEDASAILTKELLFSPTYNLSTVPLSSLKDDPEFNKPGFSFVTNPQNKDIIKNGLTNIIANLEADPMEDSGSLISRSMTAKSLEDMATLKLEDMGKTLIPLAAIPYRRSADKFLELILLLIMATGGVPPYGPDILHVRLVDDVQFQRGVYIMDDTAVIITGTGHPTNKLPAVRFMPPRVAAMIVIYMTDVQPFLRNLPFATEEYKKCNFLFGGPEGQWETARYEAVVRRETKARMGVEMGLDGFKAMFLEIAKTVLPGRYDADGYAIFADK